MKAKRSSNPKAFHPRSDVKKEVAGFARQRAAHKPTIQKTQLTDLPAGATPQKKPPLPQGAGAVSRKTGSDLPRPALWRSAAGLTGAGGTRLARAGLPI